MLILKKNPNIILS